MNRSASIKIFTFLLCLAIVSPASQAQSTAKDKTLLKSEKYIPDISTFLQIGNATPLGISWDGKTVFFKSSAPGVMQVFRINEQGWPYQLTTFEDGIDYFWPSWGCDMGIVGASVGGSEQSQLYLMDTETGQTYQLTHYDNVRFGSVMWAKDDLSIFYRSNEENGKDFFIYQMDITTGEATKIFGDTAGVDGYNGVANLSQDGQKMITYRYTSNVNNDLYLLDLQSKEYQKLTDTPEGKDAIYHSPVLMPDNKTIWLVCNDNDDGTERLAKMKVGSPEVQFVSDGWIDPKWNVDGMEISRDYRLQAAMVNENGYVSLKIRELETKRELPAPADLKGIVNWVQFAKDSTCLLAFSGSTRAPDVWRWNPYSKKLTQETFSNYAGIDRRLFSEPKLISYRSFDSLEIPAFLYLPPDYQNGKPIPFIVHAHGGPESQFQPFFLRNVQYLILNGFGVFAPNVRGSSGYGRDYLNLDNYKNRKHSLQDYKAGIDWLIEKGYTKKGMIGIRGSSYGGYVSLGMITEYPDLLSAAIDGVGISNFETYLQNTKPYRRALRESEYGPLSDPEFLYEISPVHKAHLIKTPLLVVHGENDPRVPIEEARQIIKAVQDNGGIVDSLIFHDEGHGSGKRTNLITEYRKQVEFFNRTLKSDETAAKSEQ